MPRAQGDEDLSFLALPASSSRRFWRAGCGGLSVGCDAVVLAPAGEESRLKWALRSSPELAGGAQSK